MNTSMIHSNLRQSGIPLNPPATGTDLARLASALASYPFKQDLLDLFAAFDGFQHWGRTNTIVVWPIKEVLEKLSIVNFETQQYLEFADYLCSSDTFACCLESPQMPVILIGERRQAAPSVETFLLDLSTDKFSDY